MIRLKILQAFSILCMQKNGSNLIEILFFPSFFFFFISKETFIARRLLQVLFFFYQTTLCTFDIKKPKESQISKNLKFSNITQTNYGGKIL